MREDDFTTEEYELKLLLANTRFQKNIALLRGKWSIPPKGYGTNKEWNKWREGLSRKDYDELGADIRALISEFKLSARWASPLRQYLLDNVATRLRSASYTTWRFDYEGKPAEPENIQAVWLKVDADTTLRELSKSYKQAKSMLPKQPKKQSYTYLDHALRAKELKQQGVKWSSVTAEVNKEFGTSYDENYVVKIVSRLDKHLK